MNDKNFKKPILITGLPRSGTSLTAGLLALSGAWSGSTIAGTQDNIKGFFEHAGLREQVNKAILKKLGCDPLGVRKLTPHGSLPNISNFKEIVYDVIINDGYDGSQRWMFKDAKSLLLWPYYREHFPGASWVIVKRNREDIIDSCLRTGFMKQHSTDRAFWNRWAEDYEQRIEELKASGAKCHEVWASDVFDPAKRHQLKALIKKLKLKWNDKRVKEFIEPKVWHERKEEPAN